MGVFNRSKLVGVQGISSVPEGFIILVRREGPEGLRKATNTPRPDPLNLYEFTHTRETSW